MAYARPLLKEAPNGVGLILEGVAIRDRDHSGELRRFMDGQFGLPGRRYIERKLSVRLWMPEPLRVTCIHMSKHSMTQYSPPLEAGLALVTYHDQFVWLETLFGQGPIGYIDM